MKKYRIQIVLWSYLVGITFYKLYPCAFIGETTCPVFLDVIYYTLFYGLPYFCLKLIYKVWIVDVDKRLIKAVSYYLLFSLYINFLLLFCSNKQLLMFCNSTKFALIYSIVALVLSLKYTYKWTLKRFPKRL